MSPLKKVAIGLSFAGIGAVSAITSPDTTQTFSNFLEKTEHIAVSAFNRIQGKQVDLTDYKSLANFLESGPIKPNSFSSNPQAHAKWAANRLSGEKVVKADLDAKDWQSKIRADLAHDMANLMESSFLGEASKENNLQKAVEDISSRFGENEVLAGYSVSKRSDGKPEIHVTLVSDSSKSSKFDDKIKTKHGLMALSSVNSSESPLNITVTTYQSDVVEDMAALGEKGTLNYLALNDLYHSSFTSDDYKHTAKNPEILALQLLQQQGLGLEQGAPDGRFDPSFVNALNAFVKRNIAITGEDQVISNGELVQKMALLGDHWDGNAKTAGIVFKLDKVAKTIKATEEHPSIKALKGAIEQPCSPGVSQVLSQDLRDPGFVKASQCAQQYGYSLPSNWVDKRLNENSASSDNSAATLVGFDKGVAIFALGEHGNDLGFSFSSAEKDPNKKGEAIWQSGYEDTYVVVNPFHEGLEHMSAPMHAGTMEFIAKHEIAHSLMALPRDAEKVDPTYYLRNVSEETNCDIYAVQEMIREGHSPEFVLQVHENFLDTFAGSRDFREHEVDEDFVRDIRGKSWVGNSLMDTEDVRRSLATEGGKRLLDDAVGSSMSNEMFDLINSLESAVRHSEVKNAVESFKQGNYVNVLDGLQIKQREPFAPAP